MISASDLKHFLRAFRLVLKEIRKTFVDLLNELLVLAYQVCRQVPLVEVDQLCPEHLLALTTPY